MDYLIRILNHSHWRKDWRRAKEKKKKKKISGRRKMHLGVKWTHSSYLASSNGHGSSSYSAEHWGTGEKTSRKRVALHIMQTSHKSV